MNVSLCLALLMSATASDTPNPLVRVVYPVADLVVPVDRESLPVFGILREELRKSNQVITIQETDDGSTTKYRVRLVPSNTPYCATLNNRVPATGHYVAPAQIQSVILDKRRSGEELLIELLASHVARATWTQNGGEGSIQYYPLGLAIVVNQRKDVHEKIAAFLSALQKFHDEQTQEYRVEIACYQLDERGKEQCSALPRLTIYRDRLFKLAIGRQLKVASGTIRDVTQSTDGIALANFRIASESSKDSQLKIGRRFTGKVIPMENGRIRLELAVEETELNRANKTGLLASGNVYRLVQQLRPGTPTKVVLQSGVNGEPVKWLVVNVTKMDTREAAPDLRKAPRIAPARSASDRNLP